MSLFERKKSAAPRAQLRQATRHPFGLLEGYVPLSGGQSQIYRSIREAIPVVDAAVMKLVRLTGGVSVHCENPRAEAALQRFLAQVNTGRAQRGIDTFLDAYLDSMFTFGRAVGEIVVRDGREIEALLCGNVNDVLVREGDTPLDFKICANTGVLGEAEPLPYQELLLFTPFQPEPDSPYGVSLLRSMPFLAKVLLQIYQAVELNWEHAGNLRYAVVYKPQGDVLDRACARERTEQIAREWSAAMQSGKNGSIRDFVAVGDVDIRVIGADNQVLDSEVPVRQILEQLVAKTGLPPFLLGLSWSSTERMSVQQADLLTSEITAIRRTVTPVVEKICDLWLRMHGYDCGFAVVWDDINLQDQVEEARAALYHAQAETLIPEQGRK